MVGRKAKPAIAQGWQVSTGRKVTVATLPCSAHARPAGSQSCCWRARSKPAAVAPCPPGGSGRRCASPLWPPLAPLPSSALLAFPSYNRSIPALARPPLGEQHAILRAVPGTAETAVTSPRRLPGQGAHSPSPASSNTDTWQHVCLQKSCRNNTPSLGRQRRCQQPVTDASYVAEGFT